MSNLISYT